MYRKSNGYDKQRDIFDEKCEHEELKFHSVVYHRYILPLSPVSDSHMLIDKLDESICHKNIFIVVLKCAISCFPLNFMVHAAVNREVAKKRRCRCIFLLQTKFEVNYLTLTGHV